MASNILTQTNAKMIDIQPIGYHQSCSLNVRSNVTNRQSYNAVTGEFVPDYTLSALVIYPECRVLDTDSPVPSILINAKLQSFSWEEVSSSNIKIIATDTGSTDYSKYEVITEGDNRGQISVKNNSEPGIRRTLRFVGLWIDATSGYRYRFVKDIPLIIEDVTEARANLVIDSPNTDKWNPFRQSAQKSINVKVLVGTLDKTNDANTKIFWYRVNSSTSKELINGVDDENNWEITSVAKGTNGQIIGITVDRDKIGDGISYELRCSYRSDGNLPSAPELGDPIAATTLTRCFPKIDAQFTGANARVQGNSGSILLKAIVSDSKGVIPDWNNIAYANWYETSYSKGSSGSFVETKKLLGIGPEIIVATDSAKSVQLEICDRGPMVAIVDDDNSTYMTDNNGAILVEKAINV